MKKIIIALLAVAVLGCAGNAQPALKVKGNPIAEIFNKNHPGGYPKDDPIYEVLNLAFYWGETLQSIQKRVPSLKPSFTDETSSIHRASTALREGKKRIELSADYYFDSTERLCSVFYGIAVYDVVGADPFVESMAEAYLKILKATYGNKPKTDILNFDTGSTTNYLWQNGAWLEIYRSEVQKQQVINVTVGNPALIADLPGLPK